MLYMQLKNSLKQTTLLRSGKAVINSSELFAFVTILLKLT